MSLLPNKSNVTGDRILTFAYRTNRVYLYDANGQLLHEFPGGSSRSATTSDRSPNQTDLSVSQCDATDDRILTQVGF